uniref:Uncharacterized protein n=1 Tax=Rhizophora mucronata TaxID=61149 RepID=A0A2P2NHI6_RHIMU
MALFVLLATATSLVLFLVRIQHTVLQPPPLMLQYHQHHPPPTPPKFLISPVLVKSIEPERYLTNCPVKPSFLGMPSSLPIFKTINPSRPRGCSIECPREIRFLGTG